MFEFKGGKEEVRKINAECNIHPDPKKGIIHVSVLSGDADGDSFTIYIPNHRPTVLKLIQQLQDALDASQDMPEGSDGFSFNYASCAYTGDPYADEDEIGMVHWY